MAGLQLAELGGWSKLSLARQFALAGGVVMLVAAIAGGFFVSHRIEEVVVRNTANATALYMESFIAPLTQDLATREDLSEGSRAEIGALLAKTALGKRVLSFKIWRPGGLVVDASNLDIVGQRFEPTENLKRAWAGEVRASFEDTSDQEDLAEAAMGLPLLEIYSPIRDIASGKVIAVAEFYEIATQLQQDLIRARALGWATVGGAMLLISVSLFAIVRRGSHTIDSQLAALTELSRHNVSLRLRVQGAAARFSAMNDQSLRRIGADLHDGPAQLMGFAALRLDALRKEITSEKGQAEWQAIHRAVKDSITEIRSISRGLSLPDIEHKTLPEIIRNVADAHATRTGSAVKVLIPEGLNMAVPIAVKICCFRFVQEGLTNAWRHADGKGQELRLEREGDQIRLSVLDRGPGFAHLPVQPTEDETGLGLGGLMDRVESLGGHLELGNRKDGPGAELSMTLDLGEAV